MVHGWVDSISEDGVSGWCFDDAEPEKKISVRVYMNNELQYEAKANKFRYDLKSVIDTADIAFDIQFDKYSVQESISLRAVSLIGKEIELDKTEVCKSRIKYMSHRQHTFQALLWYMWPYLENYYGESIDTLFERVGGNTGNLAFATAICKHVNIQKGPSWEFPIEAKGSIGVIPCANQLGSHCNMGSMIEKVKNSPVPLVAIGLGAQSSDYNHTPEIPNETILWLKCVREKAPSSNTSNITLRGYFTQKVLEAYGLYDIGIPMGCPSLFISPQPNLGKIIVNNKITPRRIAILAGHPSIQHLQKIEANLVKLAVDHNGFYIIQSDKNMLKIADRRFDLLDKGWLDSFFSYIMPNKPYRYVHEWLNKNIIAFYSTDAWMQFYRTIDFVIGARIHGIILALQAGIPAICIAHDSRTLELCQIMKIPYLQPYQIHDDLTIDNILDYFVFDEHSFDDNRRHLATNYLTFLYANNLQPKPLLHHIVGYR